MILLALGSNLGDRLAYLGAARTALDAFDMTVTAVSDIHETPALMPENAPAEWDTPYLNQVVRVETHLHPRDMLLCLKHIELELGRNPNAPRWAPREIDLDILSYNDEIILEDDLVIPHPHMDSRAFVLKPLTEIAPDWHHPVLNKTVRQLLMALCP